MSGLTYGPGIVTNGIYSVWDAKNSSCYDSTENLVANSTYNATDWSNVFASAATITIGIAAPDGTNTAIRFTGNTTGTSLYRINFPSISTSGTDYISVSFYARLISQGATGWPTTITYDFDDRTPSGNYSSQLVQGQWVRIQGTAIPTVDAVNSFLDLLTNGVRDIVIDFWGVQVERGDTVTSYTSTSGSVKNRGTGLLDDIRTGSVNPTTKTLTLYGSTTQWKNEGYFNFSNNTTNYLMNTSYPMPTNTVSVNVWARQTSNTANIFTYHDATSTNEFMLYVEAPLLIRPHTKGDNTWSITPSSTVLNRWINYCWTMNRTTGVEILYMDGVQVSTITRLAGTSLVSNGYLVIGQEADSAGGSFDAAQNLDGDFGFMSIYNRVLSASEVNQNFQALRGRYGL